MTASASSEFNMPTLCGLSLGELRFRKAALGSDIRSPAPVSAYKHPTPSLTMF